MRVLGAVLVGAVVVLLLALAVLWGLMVHRRPSEVQQLAGEPPLGQVTFTRAQPRAELPYDPSATRRRRTGGAAAQTAAAAAAEEAALDRAFHLLSTLVKAAQARPQVTEGQWLGQGRGIVLVVNEPFQQGTEALLVIHHLREDLHCLLPIELWHRNAGWPNEFTSLLASLDVTVRNLDQVASLPQLHPLALPALGLVHSQFQQVLLLDPSSLPLYDPTPLFDGLTPEAPAQFWSSPLPLGRQAACWRLLDDQQQQRLNYNWSQEGSLVLVDKQHCGKAVQLCAQIALQVGPAVQRLFPTEADVWHFSWLATGSVFRMRTVRPGSAGHRAADGQFVGHTLVYEDERHQPFLLWPRWAPWSTAVTSTVPRWTEYQRFATAARGRWDAESHRLEDGPVERGSFAEVVDASVESQCRQHLEPLRQMPWYQARFATELQHLTATP